MWAGLDGPEIECRVGRNFPPVQTGPVTHPALCTMGTGSFPGVKYGRGVLLTTHPLLVPLSWKSRAIPLPTLWATTGPVTGKLHHFTFYFRESKPSNWWWKRRLNFILILLQTRVQHVACFCVPSVCRRIDFYNMGSQFN